MDYSIFIKQLDAFLAAYKTMQNQSKHKDLSDLPKEDRQGLVTRSIVAVHRVTGLNSTYSLEIERLMKRLPALHLHTSSVIGIVQALRDDLNDGYVQNLQEVVHAEVFSDFIEMAQHLNETGYKDPAAVLAGSALEVHLKKLSIKNGIAIDIDGKPVKADKLNADLAKANVYGLLDQKSITAYLDLRNKAAHGQYSEYAKDQVSNLILGVTEFMKRNPA